MVAACRCGRVGVGKDQVETARFRKFANFHALDLDQIWPAFGKSTKTYKINKNTYKESDKIHQMGDWAPHGDRSHLYSTPYVL
jgi:hypothetical protein